MTTGDIIEDAQVAEEVLIPYSNTGEINMDGEDSQASTLEQEQIREWAEEYARIYKKMHTPFVREYRKVGRNKICPFCNSGLKFKYCECFQKYGEQVSY